MGLFRAQSVSDDVLGRAPSERLVGDGTAGQGAQSLSDLLQAWSSTALAGLSSPFIRCAVPCVRRCLSKPGAIHLTLPVIATLDRPAV